MHTLALELDAVHEVPTATDPNELPDQSGPRYPLARVERADMGILSLIWYLLRVWRWRLRRYK